MILPKPLRKTVFTIATIIMASVSASAQSLSEMRQIKTTALQIYENYKAVISGLYSRSVYTEDNFLALFDSQAALYNDILPDNQPQQLSPSGYFQKFQANVRRIYPAYSDFSMGEPVSAGNKWQIVCHFTRVTRFRTQKDRNYPEWTFNYTMTIEMDKRYDVNKKVFENAGIVSVAVDNPLTDFFIIENKENIPLAAQSGEMIKEWDEEYQSRIFPEDEWKMDDIRVVNNDKIFEFSKGKFSKNQTDTNYYQLNVQRYKKNILGIGVNYSPLALGNKISMENDDNFEVFKYETSEFSLSFGYGKQIAHKGKSTVFVNFGLGLNWNLFKYNGKQDIIPYDVNNDGKPNLRKIKIKLYNNEKINIISASVPFSVQYFYQLTQQMKKPIILSVELGAFAEVGLLSSLNNIYIGGYKYYYGTTDELSEPDKSSVIVVKLNSRLDGGIFGGVGLCYALNKSNLLKFSISHKYRFNLPIQLFDTNVQSDDGEVFLLHSVQQNMQNTGFGISWVKTIGRK